MSSWTPPPNVSNYIRNLQYYHQVGLNDYITECLSLFHSITYAHKMNEFLFVFDVVNSVSHEIPLFQSTLKKNPYVKFISYFPESGFNIKDRKDLIDPMLGKGPPLPLNKIAIEVFQFQDKYRTLYQKAFTDLEIPLLFDISVVLSNAMDTNKIEKIVSQLQNISGDTQKTIWVANGSKEQIDQLIHGLLTNFIVYSPHSFTHMKNETKEQKQVQLSIQIASIEIVKESKFRFAPKESPMIQLLKIFKPSLGFKSI